MAAYQVVCSLLRADRPEDAEHLALMMAELVSGHARSDAPNLVSVAGAVAYRGRNRGPSDGSRRSVASARCRERRGGRRQNTGGQHGGTQPEQIDLHLSLPRR